MDDASAAASSTGRLRIKGRVGVIATRQPVALMAQRERVVSLQAGACGCLKTRNTRASPEPKAEDSTQLLGGRRRADDRVADTAKFSPNLRRSAAHRRFGENEERPT